MIVIIERQRGRIMNKEIMKTLGNSKNFDINVNNNYVAEMLEGQLDSFIKNSKVKLSDDDFEKWVKEIQVLCAECYKHGWERALQDAEDNRIIIKPPCKIGDKVYYVNKYTHPMKIEEFKVNKIAVDSAGYFELHFMLNGRDEFLFCSRTTNDVCFTREKAEKRLKELKGETK